MMEIMPKMGVKDAALAQQIEHLITSLPPLRGQYPANRTEVEATRKALEQLDTKADRAWIAQRVVTLLAHYYISDFHPAAMEIMANDWVHELDDYPVWAIDAAVTWWLSKDNPDRRKKPLPGDISARAHVEIAVINVGRKMLERYERYGDAPPAFLQQ